MFGKVFASMYDGTLATRGPWQALVTFQQFIVLADRTGIVDMTPEAMSRRTTIPIDIIKIGISALEQPDNESRSPELEGQRIARLSDVRAWGWQIVNFEKYRKIRSEDDRREYMANLMRERRKSAKKNSGENKHALAKLAHADADADAINTSRAKKQSSLPDNFQISENVKSWCEKNGVLNADKHFEFFIGQAKAKGYRYVSWDQALMNAIRNDWAKLGTGQRIKRGVAL